MRKENVDREHLRQTRMRRELLAALSLISCAVFLKKTNRQGWMLYVPMLFMLAVTFTALVITIVQLCGLFSASAFAIEKHALQLIFAVLLLALGVMVAIQGVQKLTEKKAA